MSNQTQRSLSRLFVRPMWALGIAWVMTSFAAPTQAGEARTGVKAKHGEIVLLRDVPARHAIRTQPPGVALIIDPRPNRQLEGTLGTGGELDDAEIANLSAGSVQSAGRITGARMTQLLSTSTHNGSGSSQITHDNALPGTNPMGTVGSATRGIGTQVQHALGALPMPNPANGR